MNHAARQLIPVLADVTPPEPTPVSAEVAAIHAATERTTRLWQLFDSLADQGYSVLELFEVSTPGATEALRTWAATLGHRVVERSITPPGSLPLIALTVTVRRPDGTHALKVSVTRNGEVS